MMIIGIILSYIFSIFLNRYINKVLVKIDKNNLIAVILWFFYIFGTACFLTVLLIDLFNKFILTDKFKGKNW